jgi:hypothetical protein
MSKATVDAFTAARASLVSRHAGDDGSVEYMLRTAANNPNDAPLWVAVASARRQFLMDATGCVTLEQAKAIDARLTHDSRR